MCDHCRTHHPELFTHKPAAKPAPEKVKKAPATKGK